ncbi:hypothetical protein RB598_004361 [Gaeumannomyces tritici]
MDLEVGDNRSPWVSPLICIWPTPNLRADVIASPQLQIAFQTVCFIFWLLFTQKAQPNQRTDHLEKQFTKNRLIEQRQTSIKTTMTIKLAKDDELLQALAASGGLKGHNLLMLLPSGFQPDAARLDELRAKYPGLQISVHESAWGNTVVPESVSGSGDGFGWEDVTILATGTALPTREQAPRLQYVQLISAGANHVLQNPLFDDESIALCTANGVHGPQISEWIISTFLSSEHHLPRYIEKQKEGKWDPSYDGVDDAVGRRVGVLGYGSIGRQVARLCKALGMDVHAYTLHPRETPESRRDDAYAPPGTGDPNGEFPSRWFSGGSRADLHRFLSSGLDLLVVSAPLTDKTAHLLGADEFALLGEGNGKGKTFLSNIARGKVVDTDALVAALEGGVLRGAALDVTDPEPLPEGHPLWRAKNVCITPHVSAASSKLGPRILSILDMNLGRFSQRKPLANRVNRKEGY